jgi:GNAT superfamily N-acetyltransferase
VIDTSTGTVTGNVAIGSESEVAAGARSGEPVGVRDSDCESHPATVNATPAAATATARTQRRSWRRDRGTIRIVDDILVRTAVEGDVASLRVIFRRSSWSNVGDRPLLTVHPEFLELSPLAIREGRTRVAEVGGRIVGFTSVVRAGEVVELEDLFVDPDWMRRGIARALIADVAERARTAGARRVEVDGNDHAHGFYLSAGFVAGERVTLEHGVAARMTLAVVIGAGCVTPGAS